MVANNVDGKIHVHYQRAHVGHSQTIRYLHLTKEERDILAGKIKAVYQFTCTCMNDQVRGNFCKHVHACIRVSKRTDLEIHENEFAVTAAFEEQTAKIVETAPKKSVHVGDSVPSHSRLAALLNATLTVSSTATEEAVEKAISRVQSIYEFLQQNQSDPSVSSTASFPKLPTNLPSHKNLEKQRFYTTRSTRKPTDHKFAKPTDLEKASIKAAVNDPEFSREIIHNTFDHDYDYLNGTQVILLKYFKKFMYPTY